MASGNISASSTNQYVVGNLSWSSTPNISGNYSDVYVELRMWRNNTGYTTYGTGSWTITIDGVGTSRSSSVSLTYNSNTFILSASARVYHNGDGSKAITISATGGISGTSYTATYCSGTATLDTIARASQPSLSASSTALGTAMTIYTNKLSGFTHTIRYAYGSSSGTIATGVVDSVGWTPPLTLASQTPSSTSGSGTIYCDTYNGSTLIGTKTVGMTLTVPSSVVPTITGITCTELNTAVSGLLGTGTYAQNLSNLRFAITGATGVHGSSISSYNITFNGVSHKSQTWDSGALSISGTYSATATVTDSRGRTSATASVSVTLMPYTPPKISSFTALRCNSDGSLNELGTYVKIVRSGTAQSMVVSSAEKNTIKATVQYRDRLSSGGYTVATGCTVAESSSVASAVGSTAILVGSGTTFDISKSYDIVFLLTDKFNTTVSSLIVSTGTTVMSWSQSGVGVGKVWQSGALDVEGNANINGTLKLTGGLLDTSWSTTNTGSTSAGQYTKIASLSIAFQYADSFLNILMANNADGGANLDNSMVSIRVKQQAAMGSPPYVEVRHFNSRNMYVVYAVLTSNTASLTTVDVYLKVNASYTVVKMYPIGYYGSVSMYNLTNYSATLPAGTQYTANHNIYSGGYAVWDANSMAMTGAVLHFARSTPPSGWLVANGSAISRTTYATLYAAIGTTFGSGDGSTTFNIPDLRGEFIRGWDNSRGVDSGRTFGSSQADDFKSHPNHVDDTGGGYLIYSTQLTAYPSSQFNIYAGNETQVAQKSLGGVETRPRNIALLPCIKY